MTEGQAGVLRWLEARVDSASLKAFRVIFGLTLAAGAVRFMVHDWVHAQFGVPARALHHFGLAWLAPLGEHGMFGVECVALVAALALAHGRHQRLAAAVFGAAFTYLYFSDVTWYLNHAYLVTCVSLLLVFVPTSGATVPRWALLLVRLQVGLVYFFGGVAKLQADWLLHAQPLRIWLPANDDFPVLGPLFTLPVTAYVMSWAGAAFDLTIPFWLSWRRSRPFAYVVAVGFHTMTGLLFQIGMFPWIMSGAILIFFAPDWPRRVLARFGKRLPDDEASTALTFRPLLFAAAAWAAFQVLFPLRQHLYEGNQLWTEQGFRFAWNVMVMEKNGTLELRTVDRQSGRASYVDLSRYVTPVQLKQASTQPDLIVQLAHWVADDAKAEGREVAVYAETHVALNGRRAQPLIDPTVDLTQVHDGFGPRTWVTRLIPAAPPAPSR